FWCINQTLGLSSNHEAWHTLPYHSYIPSFGEWGFIMAARYPLNPDRIRLPLADYRYLDQAMLDPLFRFPPDMATVDTQVNELSSHALLRYYEQGWSEWYE
ncbi:MAG: hypothetical protein KDI15_14040, partial [Thiothrix sp.]|nr:hypothetical protein [Thiothrix sp.]